MLAIKVLFCSTQEIGLQCRVLQAMSFPGDHIEHMGYFQLGLRRCNGNNLILFSGCIVVLSPFSDDLLRNIEEDRDFSLQNFIL